MTDELKEDIKRVAYRTFSLWRDYFNNNDEKSQGEILSIINNSLEVAIDTSEYHKKADTSKNNYNIANVSLRDFFAAEAMKGLLTGLTSDDAWINFAKMSGMKSDESAKEALSRMSFTLADAMLAKKHES